MPGSGIAGDRRRLAAVVGLIVLVGAVPLWGGRVQLGPVPLDAVIACMALAVALAVPLLVREGAGGLVRIGAETPILAFLGWSMLATVVAGIGADALATWVRYAAYATVVVIAGTALTDARARRAVMRACAASSTVVAGMGLLQYLNPREGLGMSGLGIEIATRVTGTYDNPNFFSEYLVLSLAVTIALLLTDRGSWRLAGGGMLIIQLLALLLTYTRGSWIAFAVGCVAGLSMVSARLTGAFVAGSAVMLPLVPGALARITSVASLEGTASFRLRLWRVAGRAIEQNPVFGVGIGRFYDAFRSVVLSSPDLQVGYLIFGAHNSYFQVTAETGLPGGLMFVWMVVALCSMGWYYNARLPRRSPEALANAALTVGLVAFALNALTSNSFQHPRGAFLFFVVAGLQAAVGSRVLRSREQVAPTVVLRGPAATSLTARAFDSLRAAFATAWAASATRAALIGRTRGGGNVYGSSVALGRIIGGRGRGDVG